jgi:hypothetical protein
MKTWHLIAVGVALVAAVGLLSMTVGVNFFLGHKAPAAQALR